MFFKRKPQAPIDTDDKRDDDSHSASSSAVSFDIAATVRTDRGCIREGNEDAGRHMHPNDPEIVARKGTLTVVCDGMGGHLGGEVASNLAIETISRLYYASDRPAADALKDALQLANSAIHEAAGKDGRLSGMGTTCTALVLLGRQAICAHVGDSRLYMIRAAEIFLLTEDHSAVMEMVKHGIISREEARHHEDKNVILRALGTSPTVEPTLWDQPLAVLEGDKFLLCSDGLYDLVEDEEIRASVVDAIDDYAACEKLIAIAKERGGHDNITVCIVSVSSHEMTNVAATVSVTPQTREVEVSV